MGELTTPLWLILFAALIAAAIIALNVKLLWDQAFGG
jgi:Mn2+/Fe2+ NRAMP family transporter